MRRKPFLALIPLLFSLSLHAQLTFDTSVYVKDNPGLYSIVISVKDHIVYQHYFNGHRPEELFNNQSLTKSIVSLLLGIAIDKGFIPSVDEPIVRYFPSLRNDPDTRKQHITIRQIMNQASGLWHENLDSIPEYLALADQSGYVLTRPMVSGPGQVFHYSNAASHLLSVILTRATRMSTLAFAQQNLFGPLAIRRVQWNKMRDGYYDGCGLLSVQMPTADMNKIGRLILDKGIYQGKRVVSEAWATAILQPTKTYATPWGFQPSMYGLCYYHHTYAGKAVTYGMGWGGQFLVLIPDGNIVITVNENPDNQGAIRQSIQFTDKIFPLIMKDLLKPRSL